MVCPSPVVPKTPPQFPPPKIKTLEIPQYRYKFVPKREIIPLWRTKMKEFDRLSRIDALGLTDIQKLFCECYVLHFNRIRAVKESGSKCSTPCGCEWMALNPNRQNGKASQV